MSCDSRAASRPRSIVRVRHGRWRADRPAASREEAAPSSRRWSRLRSVGSPSWGTKKAKYLGRITSMAASAAASGLSRRVAPSGRRARTLACSSSSAPNSSGEQPATRSANAGTASVSLRSASSRAASARLGCRTASSAASARRGRPAARRPPAGSLCWPESPERRPVGESDDVGDDLAVLLDARDVFVVVAAGIGVIDIEPKLRSRPSVAACLLPGWGILWYIAARPGMLPSSDDARIVDAGPVAATCRPEVVVKLATRSRSARNGLGAARHAERPDGTLDRHVHHHHVGVHAHPTDSAARCRSIVPRRRGPLAQADAPVMWAGQVQFEVA